VEPGALNGERPGATEQEEGRRAGMKRYKTTRYTQRGVRRPIKVQRYYQGQERKQKASGAAVALTQDDMLAVRDIGLRGERGIFQLHDFDMSQIRDLPKVAKSVMVQIEPMIELHPGDVDYSQYLPGKFQYDPQPDYQRSEQEQAVDAQKVEMNHERAIKEIRETLRLPDDGKVGDD
jgi:hypothetical protein